MAHKQRFSHFALRYFFFLLVIPLLWVFVDYIGWIEYVEYATLDWRFRARGERDAPINLIYVDLDTESIEFIGERPIPRKYFGEAAESLFKYGKAKVIGIDAVFSKQAHSELVDDKKMKDDTDSFRKVIEDYPNLVLAAAYTQGRDVVNRNEKLVEFPYIYLGFANPDKNALPEQPQADLIGTKGGNLGLINVASNYSPGAIERWMPMFSYSPGPTYLTLSLEMMRLYYDVPKTSVDIQKDKILLKNKEGKVILNIPLTDNQLVEVNWFSKWRSDKNLRYSLKTAIAAKVWMEQGNDEQKAQAQEFYKKFNDAVVLIGPTDPLMQDMAPTPFDKSAVPKVGVHGNLIKTLVTSKYLERPPFWVSVILIYLFTSLVVAVGSYPGRLGNLFKLLSVIILLGYGILTFVLFDTWVWVLPLVTPIGAAVSTGFTAVVIQLIETERQRSYIKDLFGAYVSPELVEHMVEEDEAPHLGGEEKEITALFSDIESFTTICEKLTPSDVILIMNEYLSAMTSVIQEEHGTLDKYIGDAIVSMFGAPVTLEEHALAACRTACKMQKKQMKLRLKWQAEGDRWSDNIKNMKTRIGLNSGSATIGNMGSEVRFNYTMLGDNVNLASRCEAGAKVYGVYVMVTESTYLLAKNRDEVVFRHLDKILVKGKFKPVSVYEIMGLKEDITEKIAECIALFEKGFEKYNERKWDEAISFFEKALLLEPNAENEKNPSKIFIARCLELKQADPGLEWDGVFHMKEKEG